MNGNGSEAARLYTNAFPDQMQHYNSTSHAVCCRVTGTGFVALQIMVGVKTRSARTFDHEENVLQAVGEDTDISTRQVVQACRT